LALRAAAAAGALLKRKNEIHSAEVDWVHYMVPMEYDSQQHCSTALGWNDPRGCDDDGEPLVAEVAAEREGALMWPERFGPAEIAALKASLGPLAGTRKNNWEIRRGAVVRPARPCPAAESSVQKAQAQTGERCTRPRPPGGG
jgi:hypothetical protein